MYVMTFVNRANPANNFVVTVETAEKVQSYLKMMVKQYSVLTKKNGKIVKAYTK